MVQWVIQPQSNNEVSQNAIPRNLELYKAAKKGLSLGTATYFSFVTLATLGYRAVVPRSEVARGVAIIEAVAGQLYLGVMIARLVSLDVFDKR